MIYLPTIYFSLLVSRAESDDNAPFPGTRRLRARLRISSQIEWPGADQVPGQKTLRRSLQTTGQIGRFTLPEGPGSGQRSGHQSFEIVQELVAEELSGDGGADEGINANVRG